MSYMRPDKGVLCTAAGFEVISGANPLTMYTVR